MSKLAILGGRKLRNKPFPRYPTFGREEKEIVKKVLDSGVISGFIAKFGDNFLGGPYVRELERRFTLYFDVRFAMAVNSATAGLHAAVASLNLGPGDEIIVPPYTMSASASAILMQNAIPVFCDIQDDIFSLTPGEIEKNITPRTKAIIVVHLFGHPADMDPIMRIAKKYSLKVIEDCAQSPGAIYKGRKVGTIGDIGVFSFNQHKTITTGEGGVVITNNIKLAEKIQLVRNHGEAVVGDMGYKDIVNTLGWNYRMTELEAAVGIEQFKKLDKLTQPRIEIAQYFSDKLSIYPGLTLPRAYPKVKHVYFVYAIKFDTNKLGISRNLFVKALIAEGIPFGQGYVKPLYLEPLFQKKICYGKSGCPFKCKYYKGTLHYEKGACPVCERLHEKELITTNLCHANLKQNDVKCVVLAFDKIYTQINALKKYTEANR